MYKINKFKRIYYLKTSPKTLRQPTFSLPISLNLDIKIAKLPNKIFQFT